MKPPTRERSACVYAVNERLVVAATPKTSVGVHVVRDPIAIAGADDLAALADALTQALAASARVIPHPAQSEWKGSFKPVLKAAAVPSLKVFMASAALVSVEDDGVRLTLTPYRNLGSHGFEPIPSQAEQLDQGDVEATAKAVRRLLRLSDGGV